MDPPHAKAEAAAAAVTAPTPPRPGKAEKGAKATTLLDVEERAKLSPAPKRGGFLADLLGRHAVSICSGDGTAADSSAARAGRRRGGRGSFREVEKV
ncbi:hypothetical protein C2845_PM12G26480 [Panicum miliaceum]|uniref:Uncharacterized protein n=1 Tax=Panicum miliaceum TaxID=4540 RepID=A0A3L6QBB4_PANMI|nr:hypothetical protein C2845_PM12G26480 [Panicum miliaceum]